MMQYKSSLDEMIKSVESRIIGKKSVIQKVFVCFLAGGHVLLEDVPGVGKTMLGKSLAHALGITFSRIQFTPDTLPGDVCGMSVYNMATGAFEVMQGPVMNNLLLADEINGSFSQDTGKFIRGNGRATGNNRRYFVSSSKTFFCYCNTESNQPAWNIFASRSTVGSFYDEAVYGISGSCRRN